MVICRLLQFILVRPFTSCPEDSAYSGRPTESTYRWEVLLPVGGFLGVFGLGALGRSLF